MKRAAWLIVLAACSSKPKEAAPAPPPAPKPPPAVPVQAERPPPEVVPAPDAAVVDQADGLGSFYVIGASADGAQVLLANVYAASSGGVVEYRALSTRTGAIEAKAALPSLSKLPSLFEHDATKWTAALENNTALIAEMQAAAEVVLRFPGGDGSVLVTSADRSVVAIRRDLHWIVLRDGKLSQLPEEHVDPWIAPDGKTIVHSSKPITKGLANASNLYVDDLATGKSTKALGAGHVMGVERWRLAPGGSYVRVPYGGDELCIGDVPLNGAKPRAPQCFGKVPTPLLVISDNGQWLAIESDVGGGKMRLRVVDLEARKTFVDTAKLELGDAGVDDGLLVSSTGMTVALHGTRGFQIDASNGKVTEFTHQPELSCVVVGARLGCVKGTTLVFEDPSSQKP